MVEKDKAESMLLNLALRGYQIMQKKVIQRSRSERIIRVNELSDEQDVILIAIPRMDGMFKNLGMDFCKTCHEPLSDGKCKLCNSEQDIRKVLKKKFKGKT